MTNWTKARIKYEKACLAVSEDDDEVQEWLSEVARLKTEKEKNRIQVKTQIADLKRNKAERDNAIDKEIERAHAKIRQRVWVEYKERPDIKPLFDEMVKE